MSHRKSMEPLGKEVQKIRKECKGNLSKQLSAFQKIKDTLFKVYDDQFIDFDEDLKDLIGLTKELENDIKKLINFFKKENIL